MFFFCPFSIGKRGSMWRKLKRDNGVFTPTAGQRPSKTIHETLECESEESHERGESRRSGRGRRRAQSAAAAAAAAGGGRSGTPESRGSIGGSKQEGDEGAGDAAVGDTAAEGGGGAVGGAGGKVSRFRRSDGFKPLWSSAAALKGQEAAGRNVTHQAPPSPSPTPLAPPLPPPTTSHHELPLPPRAPQPPVLRCV